MDYSNKQKHYPISIQILSILNITNQGDNTGKIFLKTVMYLTGN